MGHGAARGGVRNAAHRRVGAGAAERACGQGRAAARDRRVRQRGGSACEARGAGCAARVSHAAAITAAASGELQRIAETASGGSARVELGREPYPTREYETFSLPAGVYTSLRITLGAGSGRNWWCVVYPPLCTSGVETAQEAAVLSDDDVKLITEDGEGYVLRFRLLEWWGSLTGK